MDQKRCPRAVSSSALRMLPPGTLVNAIRSALDFVILPECFASFLSLATPDEMPKADRATIKITERRKSLGFMIQVRLIRECRSQIARSGYLAAATLIADCANFDSFWSVCLSSSRMDVKIFECVKFHRTRVRRRRTNRTHLS